MNTVEQRVAFVNSQTACFYAELEAMKLANILDEQAGRPFTYNSQDFSDLPNQFQLGHNTVVEYLTDV